jgi:hypothetical protein
MFMRHVSWFEVLVDLVRGIMARAPALQAGDMIDGWAQPYGQVTFGYTSFSGPASLAP